MEVRDVALFVLPTSLKPRHAVAVALGRVEGPHLHHLPSFSLSSYLEDVGFARVVTADFIDLSVHLQDLTKRDPHLPHTTVELTNGTLDVLTCTDSFALLTQLLSHLSAQLEAASTQEKEEEKEATVEEEEKKGGRGECKEDEVPLSSSAPPVLPLLFECSIPLLPH